MTSNLREADRVPFFPSHSAGAGPRDLFARYPEIYGPWAKMSEALMNGSSPLSDGQRELIMAYAAGVAGCDNVRIAHSEVAYAAGIECGLVDQLLEDPDTAPVDARLRPLLAFVKTLAIAPGDLTQADADAVFAAGWDEKALHDAIAITARAAFMQRLVQGHGFVPLSQEEAARRAADRTRLGYVNLFPQFRAEP